MKNVDMTRRDLMQLLTIGIFALLCGFLSACRSGTDIHEETVTYTADDVVMKGYLAYNEKIQKRRPGVLVVHEFWGNNEGMRKRARMLAEAGYTALAVDMYGEGRQAENIEEAGQLARQITQNIPLERSRFVAAMNVLKKHNTVDPGRISAIGYSFGGSVVLQMARAGEELKGVVSFYGALSTPEPAQPGAVKAKVLICLGENDFYIPVQDITLFKNEMRNAGVDYRIITYASAGHGFADPEAKLNASKFKLNLEYNAEADKKAWTDMNKFLQDMFRS